MPVHVLLVVPKLRGGWICPLHIGLVEQCGPPKAAVFSSVPKQNSGNRHYQKCYITRPPPGLKRSLTPSPLSHTELRLLIRMQAVDVAFGLGGWAAGFKAELSILQLRVDCLD